MSLPNSPRPWNRVEDPHAPARLDVEPADVALLVALAARHAAGEVRGADDDGVAGDERRRVQPDLAGDEVHDLVVVQLQIDDAVLAEAGDRGAAPGIERDEPVAGRDVENPLLPAVGPVREATAGQLAGRGFGALTFPLAVHPHQLAGRRVERHHRPPRPGGRVHDATHHQRRGLELIFGPGTEAFGLESPRDLQLAEIVRGDLIERRIARVAEVGAVGRPLALLRARLAGNWRRRQQQQAHHRNGSETPSTNDWSHASSERLEVLTSRNLHRMSQVSWSRPSPRQRGCNKCQSQAGLDDTYVTAIGTVCRPKFRSSAGSARTPGRRAPAAAPRRGREGPSIRTADG